VNISPDQPTLAEALAEMVRADDEHAARYGEDPDPLVRRNALERLAASMAWDAHEGGQPATTLGAGIGAAFTMKVLEVACVVPVQVAVLWRLNGDFAGVWPWNGSVQIWPDEMVCMGIGADELAALESRIFSLPLAAENIGIPWEEPTHGDES
jgi:hypothetical protein